MVPTSKILGFTVKFEKVIEESGHDFLKAAREAGRWKRYTRFSRKFKFLMEFKSLSSKLRANRK